MSCQEGISPLLFEEAVATPEAWSLFRIRICGRSMFTKYFLFDVLTASGHVTPMWGHAVKRAAYPHIGILLGEAVALHRRQEIEGLRRGAAQHAAIGVFRVSES